MEGCDRRHLRSSFLPLSVSLCLFSAFSLCLTMQCFQPDTVGYFDRAIRLVSEIDGADSQHSSACHSISILLGIDSLSLSSAAKVHTYYLCDMNTPHVTRANSGWWR